MKVLKVYGRGVLVKLHERRGRILMTNEDVGLVKTFGVVTGVGVEVKGGISVGDKVMIMDRALGRIKDLDDFSVLVDESAVLCKVEYSDEDFQLVSSRPVEFRKNLPERRIKVVN